MRAKQREKGERKCERKKGGERAREGERERASELKKGMGRLILKVKNHLLAGWWNFNPLFLPTHLPVCMASYSFPRRAFKGVWERLSVVVTTRAVAVTKVCQPVIVKQITVGLTVIDRYLINTFSLSWLPHIAYKPLM